MNRKGAIELTANFLVVIIISSIIVVGGLALFFNIKDDVEKYTGELDRQTQDKLKSIVLSNAAKAAVYPSDPIVDNGDSLTVGVGIINNFDTSANFDVKIEKILFYKDSDSEGNLIDVNDYYTFIETPLSIDPGTQGYQAILVRMPKNALAGQYIYTINIVTDTPVVDSTYEILQLYVINP